MIKINSSICDAKDLIEKLKSKSVKVTVNLGRNKYESFFGTLTGVYPALFTVLPDDKNYKGKTTYSYAEYLCGKVKLKETLIN